MIDTSSGGRSSERGGKGRGKGVKRIGEEKGEGGRNRERIVGKETMRDRMERGDE